MNTFLFTPKRGIYLGLVAAGLILVQPAFTYLHYYWNLKAHAYPANADSIGIPIYTEWVCWLYLAPLALLGLWWSIRKYPGRVYIFGWNRSRPIWTIFWTFIFTILTLFFVEDLPESLRWLNPFLFLNIVLWTALFLILRAIVINKKTLI